MNDIERELRDVLEREARDAPTPHETHTALRRTRRRQLRIVAATSLGVAAAVVVAVAGFRSLGGEPDRLVPGSTTQTMNGITITFPETWFLIDPDEAGLNGPTGSEPTEDLPRLILALSPTEPGDAFGCPGLGQTPGPPPSFLMTIQEMPLALAGDPARPWPVELEPLEVDASESGCYPGWAFSQTAWSAADRTFVAAVGIAPDVSDAERAALLDVFASMTFEPVADGATSVVLATGTAGGEDWELIASRGSDGLELSLQGESFGTGTSGFDPVSDDELRLTGHVFGEGTRAERVVFAAVPTDVVLIVGVDSAFATVYPEVLDVPDEIDPRLNAFVVTIDADTVMAFEAFDARDRLLASGRLHTEGTPLEAPLPEPDEVLFDGRTNECWWTLTRTSEGPDLERLQLASPLDDLLAELVADVGPDAPPLQLGSFVCPRGGVLVFGLVTDQVAEIEWVGQPEGRVEPSCIDAELPDRFCVFLEDLPNGGEAIALDAESNEIGRATFG